MPDERSPETTPRGQNSLFRFAGIIVVLSVLALTLLACLYAASGRFETLSVSLTILVGIPFCIGAVSRLLFRLFYRAADDTVTGIAFIAVFVALCVSAIVLREAMICILMAAPFLLIGGWLGVFFMGLALQRRPDSPRANGAALLFIPFALLGTDLHLKPTTQDFTVSRDVLIDAPVERVRPLLFDMRDISEEEGRWNITQDVFGVPRPVSAVVDADRRMALWQNDVSFEEHIEFMSDNEMRWRFVFPNDSVARHSDRHISPDGVHLKVESGGYQLEALPDGRTRLTLSTTYVATTPVNAYASLWGELILGDIQSNVLAIIEGRAEAQSVSN
ncbi:hypothetical protein WNY37_01275 [Henriciella sp. AS95]|uniref:hypothetical protein n=1 Tax=Henriciella sp. AS95 TaxID=3135782 RepID=UPI00316F6043